MSGEHGLGSDSCGRHVLHVYRSLSSKQGGPPAMVARLCERLGAHGNRVELCVADHQDELDSAVPLDRSVVEVHAVAASPPRGLGRYFLPMEFRRTLESLADSADVVHSHGLWGPANQLAAKAARRTGSPHVISLHNMLDRHSLAQKRLKKWVGAILFGRRNLAESACLHALTEKECRDARQYGTRRPVAVIPNAIDVKDPSERPSVEEAQRQWPELVGRKTLLFLARLHPVKGLANLVPAWCRVATDHPDWQLVLAGPDEVGLRATLERCVQKAGVEEQTHFTGGVHGLQKQSLMVLADGFCLSSFTEGLSMSILEALSVGIPVLLTSTCYFEDARRAEAGMVVEPTLESIEVGLREFMTLDDQKRKQMGGNGMQLVRDKYSWPAVVSQFEEVYDWVLGRRDVPDCVRLD